MANKDIPRNKTEKEGPTLREIPATMDYRCHGCKHLEVNIIRGGDNSMKDFSCSMRHIAEPGTDGYIGHSDRTPSWCPVWRNLDFIRDNLNDAMKNADPI